MLDITNQVRAGYPALCIETYEPERFTDQLQKKFPKRQILLTDSRGLLRDWKTQVIIQMDGKATGYGAAFNYVAEQKETFLVVLDFEGMIANAVSYRPLLSAMPYCKKLQAVILLLAPSWKMPPALQHEIPVLHAALPTSEELEPALEIVEEGTGKKFKEKERREWLNVGRGLTLNEYESAASLAAIGEFNPQIIESEKMRLVNTSRAMSYEKPVPENQLGGLGRFKDYIKREVIPSMDDDQLRVKAILADGLAGTGKSLASRVLAGMLGIPLVGFSIAACKGSLMGESEGTLRAALSLAEAVAPCVLRMEEVEKALAGSASSGKTDGGVAIAMEGILLTFMQESTAPILIVGTCNDAQKLSDPMRRRFDAHFFFDLPSMEERLEVAAIHLSRFGVKLDGLPQLIANKTKDWTPAEIENLIKSAARRTKRKITEEAIDAAAADIHPLAKDPSTNITEQREWARGHLRSANSEEATKKQTPVRRIE